MLALVVSHRCRLARVSLLLSHMTRDVTALLVVASKTASVAHPELFRAEMGEQASRASIVALDYRQHQAPADWHVRYCHVAEKISVPWVWSQLLVYRLKSHAITIFAK